MKISIGIPVYNDVENIERAILSVVNQNYKNIEIIISDNNSTDGTKELLKKYSNYQNIKIFFSNENQGLIENFKKVVCESTGEYFMLLSSDDYIEAKYFEKINTLFSQIGEGVIFIPKGNIYNVVSPSQIIKEEEFGLDGSGFIKNIPKLINSEVKINFAIHGLYPSKLIKDIFNEIPVIKQLDRLVVTAAWYRGFKFYYDKNVNWYRGIKRTNFRNKNKTDDYTKAILKEGLINDIKETFIIIKYLRKISCTKGSVVFKEINYLMFRIRYVLTKNIKNSIRPYLAFLPRKLRKKILMRPDYF